MTEIKQQIFTSNFAFIDYLKNIQKKKKKEDFFGTKNVVGRTASPILS